MATDISPLAFTDDGAFVTVVLTAQASSGTYPQSIDATCLDFQDQGVMVEEDQGGTPPVIVRHFVPWANVHRIYQEVTA